MARITVKYTAEGEEPSVYKRVSPEVHWPDGMLCITGDRKTWLVPRERIKEVEIDRGREADDGPSA